MISKHLKALREKSGLTVRELASRLETKGIGGVSMIENGRVIPNDETVMRFLIKGFKFKRNDASDMLALWKIEEALKIAKNPSRVIRKINDIDNPKES